MTFVTVVSVLFVIAVEIWTQKPSGVCMKHLKLTWVQKVGQKNHIQQPSHMFPKNKWQKKRWLTSRLSLQMIQKVLQRQKQHYLESKIRKLVIVENLKILIQNLKRLHKNITKNFGKSRKLKTLKHMLPIKKV